MSAPVFTFYNVDSDIAGCSNFCCSCNHAAPWGHFPMMTPEVLYRDIHALAEFSHAQKFTLIGGEPTLNPNLLALIRVVQESGFADKLQISTNGSQLEKLPEAFWASGFNILHLTLYPNKPVNVALAEAKTKQYGIELKLITVPFHKSMIDRNRTPAEATTQYAQCPYRVECWQLWYGHLYRCPATARLPVRFMGLPQTIDGLALDENLTADKLWQYIHQPEPSHACHRCDYQKEFIDWHEADTEAEWIEQSTRKVKP